MKTTKFIIFFAVAAIVGCSEKDNNVINTNNSNTYDPVVWVDLGLPSGLLWAECNLGATVPEEYGDYYAWGETTPKSEYTWDTYQYGNASDQLTKYCFYAEYGLDGYIDNLNQLEPYDDVATVRLGGGAHMPSLDDWKELRNNTTITRTTVNGVYGDQYTAENGNTLFMPAAGYIDGSLLSRDSSDGFYWSRTIYRWMPSNAYLCNFTSDFYNWSADRARIYGLSVRAVCSPNQ